MLQKIRGLKEGKAMKLSFVIPCFCSENTISFVVDEIITTVRNLKDYDYEIVLVDDHSPDQVWLVIEKLAKKNQRIKGFSFAKFWSTCSIISWLFEVYRRLYSFFG